jgi:hypothetical protein
VAEEVGLLLGSEDWVERALLGGSLTKSRADSRSGSFTMPPAGSCQFRGEDEQPTSNPSGKKNQAQPDDWARALQSRRRTHMSTLL